MTTEAPKTVPVAIEKEEWWRAVIGEYPTGVSLVTAALPGGEPVAMIVGSFVAISQDPPLIGFFGDDASSSFRALAGAERFAVSVLGDSHDGLVRSFIRKDANRFDDPRLVRDVNGLVRLADAVAWFEARTETIQRFGDHQLVVGLVEDFNVGTDQPDAPMVYRRGGFGAFAVPMDPFDARVVGQRLSAAHAVAAELSEAADRIGRDVAITTLVGDSIVLLAVVPAAADAPAPATGAEADPRSLRASGITIPFAAPIEPLFAAWAPERTQSLWIERARHLVGAVDRKRVQAQLAAIRERGYAVSVDRDLTRRFYGLISAPRASRESYARVWSEYASRTIVSNDASLPVGDIAAIQVPVLDESGDVVLNLTVADLEPLTSSESLDRLASELLESAGVLSSALARGAREGTEAVWVMSPWGSAEHGSAQESYE